MAANDRPAEIQWLISNTTGEITGYMVGSTEYPPPPWSKDGTSMVSPPGGLSVPMVRTNAITGATELLGPDGVILYGQMVSGVWMKIPSIFRLRLAGTGTVTIDSKDSLGNITSAVATYTVSGATDQIEFPYAGDNAVAIRATLIGTATAEVI